MRKAKERRVTEAVSASSEPATCFAQFRKMKSGIPSIGNILPPLCNAKCLIWNVSDRVTVVA